MLGSWGSANLRYQIPDTTFLQNIGSFFLTCCWNSYRHNQWWKLSVYVGVHFWGFITTSCHFRVSHQCSFRSCGPNRRSWPGSRTRFEDVSFLRFFGMLGSSDIQIFCMSDWMRLEAENRLRLINDKACRWRWITNALENYFSSQLSSKIFVFGDLGLLFWTTTTHPKL